MICAFFNDKPALGAFGEEPGSWSPIVLGVTGGARGSLVLVDLAKLCVRGRPRQGVEDDDSEGGVRSCMLPVLVFGCGDPNEEEFCRPDQARRVVA